MQPRPDQGENTYKSCGRPNGLEAVITGGDGGVGRAVAIACAREGADVLIAFLNETEEANEVKKLVEKEGRKAGRCWCVGVSGAIGRTPQWRRRTVPYRYDRANDPPWPAEQDVPGE